jgi:antitoxin ParD1/3/4
MDIHAYNRPSLCPGEALIMNISFTDKQAEYIAMQVREGDYQNASEVVRDALRLHQVYRHRVIEELRAEIAKGWDGPVSERSVTDILKAKQSQHRV